MSMISCAANACDAMHFPMQTYEECSSSHLKDRAEQTDEDHANDGRSDPDEASYMKTDAKRLIPTWARGKRTSIARQCPDCRWFSRPRSELSYSCPTLTAG